MPQMTFIILIIFDNNISITNTIILLKQVNIFLSQYIYVYII